MITSCELHSLFILNPDDLMQGTNEPNGTQSFGALCVVYKAPDTLTGVFLFVENNIYHEVGWMVVVGSRLTR